jgi:hypothetical protein
LNIQRIAIFLTIGLVGSLSTALAQNPEQFPYQALILNDDVTIHAGPDILHYATDKLKRGAMVVVDRHTPDGWCAIEPPNGSFCLVPESAVKLIDRETGVIVTEGVKAWIGTHLGQVDQPQSQRTLNVDDRVEILGSITWPSPGESPATWYQIAPPPGELRWIQLSDLRPPAQMQEFAHRNLNHDPTPLVLFDQPVSQVTGNDLPSFDVEWKDDGLPDAPTDSEWIDSVRVGYDRGFVIASEKPAELNASDLPFQFRFNGWGQLRYFIFDSDGVNPNQNQFQLQRGRLVFSGSAFTSDFSYLVQLDGRSSSGDNLRLLDYNLEYDVGHHRWGLEKGTFGFKTGKYKMPFNLSRFLTAREFEFSDRSMASTFFDVNRSLAWGLYGRMDRLRVPVHWETSIFNGLVTGGAETGSSGNLDNNFAYSARAYWYPTGAWGSSQQADFEHHCQLATRVGAGWANSKINRAGSTEFSALRVVDSGNTLESILPAAVDQYAVNLYAIDASAKYRGWSLTSEYYFRFVNEFQGASVPDLFDHGCWVQVGKFLDPGKFLIMTRWSWVQGNSGTLGVENQHSSEIAAGFSNFFRGEHAKLTCDATYLDGAPINSSALDVSPGDIGWLLRTQIQFAF